MNSASLLMNLPAAAPVTAAASTAAGVEPGQAASCAGGFDQALAAAQAGGNAAQEPTLRNAEAASLALAAGLLSQTVTTAQSAGAKAATGVADSDAALDAADDAAQSGAAAILIQMLGSPGQPVPAPASGSSDVLSQATAQQPALAVAVETPAAGMPARARDEGAGKDAATGGGEGAGDARVESAAPDLVTDDALAAIGTAAAAEKTLPLPAANSQSLSTGQANNGQAAIQAAASALREAATAPAAAAPVHSSLREPVGSARWADELGNRLVLMSVRGQQQGSLTLTPEHLGPMEVQISVNRDTASVWFGAQHADTRAALAEAMPRLREMLASSGLSLGQSGVSEQAPRQSPGSGSSGSAGGSAGAEGDTVEASAPAWRAWRPGIIDTYA